MDDREEMQARAEKAPPAGSYERAFIWGGKGMDLKGAEAELLVRRIIHLEETIKVLKATMGGPR